jgi:hypothetical protein
MSIQLRQICLVAARLEPVIEDLTAILGINRCYVDPGVATFGLENTLMPVGRNFLEVVAPTQDGTAGGRYLDRRNGDGGYMVICQGDSKPTQQAVRQRALDRGVRIAMEAERDKWNICQLHPGDMIAAFLEIDWDLNDDFNGNWEPAHGLGWEDKVKQDVTVDYLGVELQSSDPEGLAKLWGEVTDLVPVLDGSSISIALNNVRLRYTEATDGRGPGLSGLDLQVANREHILNEARKRNCYVSDTQVDICGTHFYLQDA